MSKNANIRSALARFEQTISKNNEAGVESKMFLSTLANKNASPSSSRPRLTKSGSKRTMISTRKLRPVSQTSSAGTAATAPMGSSMHSRVVTAEVGGDWGTFENQNESDDPWANSDDDFDNDDASFGFGDDDDGFGYGFAGDGFAVTDEWRDCSVNDEASVTSFQSENKSGKPSSSRGGALTSSSTHSQRKLGSSSSHRRRTSPSKGSSSSSPEGPSKKSSSSRRPSTSTSSRLDGSSQHGKKSLSSLNQVGGSTHSRTSSRTKDSDDMSKASTQSRSTKAPLRSFRSNASKPSKYDDDDASVSSKRSIAARSTNSKSRSSNPRSSSVRTGAPASRSSRAGSSSALP